MAVAARELPGEIGKRQLREVQRRRLVVPDVRPRESGQYAGQGGDRDDCDGRETELPGAPGRAGIAVRGLQAGRYSRAGQMKRRLLFEAPVALARSSGAAGGQE